MSLPSKEWVDAYKDEVEVILLVDRGQYYVIGFSVVWAKYTDKGKFPRESHFRSEKYIVQFNDEDDKLTVTKRDGKVTITIDSNGVLIDTTEKIIAKNQTSQIEITNAIEMKVGGSTVKMLSGGNEIDIESPTLKLKGTTLLEVEEKNAIPSGVGALCAIPTCVFSGAPHVGNKAQ